MSTSMESEAEIIAACQRGELERFGELYDRYIAKIYRFIYFKTLHKETAEDLASKTFLNALESIGSVHPERGISPWLYRIARNAVIDHYRAARRTVAIEDVWDMADAGDIAAASDAKLKLRALKSHLVALSPLEREVVLLRVWGDLAHREIADAVGKSEDHAKVIFSRAVKKLRSAGAGALALLVISSFSL